MKKISMIFMIAVALMVLCVACPTKTTEPTDACCSDTLKLELKMEVDSVKVAVDCIEVEDETEE